MPPNDASTNSPPFVSCIALPFSDKIFSFNVDAFFTNDYIIEVKHSFHLVLNFFIEFFSSFPQKTHLTCVTSNQFEIFWLFCDFRDSQ